jgi:hypothetical protein
MEKNPNVARIDLTDALRKEPREQSESDAEPKELHIDELEPRITPTSIDSSVGTFF